METNDWQAFNLATEALREIDRFAAAPAAARPALLDARKKLKAAAARDPQFLRAKYYAAIVADMLGHPSEAIDELTDLLQQAPGFTDEARYNLAVSHYHMYSEDHVKEAIDGFDRVAQTSTDQTLKYMSNAGLVRAYAMMALHTRRKDVGASDLFAERAVTTGSELLDRVRTDKSVDKRARGEIEWRVLNGRGVARMFASDAEQALAKRETLLNDALEDFLAASALSPDNWEIVCNIGSSHMRLGVVSRASERDDDSRRHFDLASQFLTDVIRRIRPRYGFALYELGRVHRLRREYQTALALFEQALAVPEDERNIKAPGIQREIDKARTHSDVFP
jgi:tetratricopeptide (TPR) repeat protein